MRNRHAIVIAIAIAATAVWWMTTQDSNKRQDSDVFAISQPEPATQSTSVLAQATDTPASDYADPSGSALWRRGPPRDVTPAQREELVAYLFELWPDVMTEFDLTGVKIAYWGEGDDSSVGYFAEFAEDRQISTMRREKPVIACSFRFQRNTWTCQPPIYESWFEWPDQQEPVLVDSRISDDLAHFAMSNFADAERRAGGLIETIFLDRASLDVIRIGIRLPQDIGGGVHYRYYEFLPSPERGFDFVPTNPPPEHESSD